MPRKAKFTREEAESRILKAARTLFCERGFVNALVQDIADLSGLNKRLVYAFTPHKESLYLAVLSDVSREFVEFVADLKVKEESLEGQSAQNIYLKAYRHLVRHRDFVRLLVWEWMAESLEGARILSTEKMLRDKLHAFALKAEAQAKDKLAELDIRLNALIMQIALVQPEDNSATNARDAFAQLLFVKDNNYSEALN